MKLLIIISLNFVFFRSSIVSVNCTKGKHPIDDDNESKRFKHWSDADKKSLLKVFYETNTGEKNHAKRIKEEWDRSNSARKTLSSHSLYTRLVEWIESGEADRLLHEEERLHRKYKPRLKQTKWTPEMEENVLRIHKQTNYVRWGQSRLMKELWDTKQPDHSRITGHQLMMKVRDLHKRDGVISEKRKLLTYQENEDLLRCYYMASKNRGEQMKVTQELFIKRHPELANFTYSELGYCLIHFRKDYPKIDKKISKEFSASSSSHPSWSLGAASDSRREESAYIPTFSEHDLCRESDRYSGSSQNIPWNDYLLEEPSSSAHQISPDVGTSYEFLLPGPSEDHSVRDSVQYNSDQRRRKSSKEKEPVLD